MKIVFLTLIGLFISLFSVTSSAGSGRYTIESVGVSESSGTIYLKVSPNIPDTTCDRKSEVRVELQSSTFADKVYSAALTAKVANLEVALTYTDTCLFNGPTLKLLEII